MPTSSMASILPKNLFGSVQSVDYHSDYLIVQPRGT